MKNRFVLVKLDHFIEIFSFVSNNRRTPSIVLTLRLGLTRPFYIGTKLDTHRLSKQNELMFSEQVVRLALQRTILFMVNILNLVRIQVQSGPFQLSLRLKQRHCQSPQTSPLKEINISNIKFSIKKQHQETTQ